MSTDATWKTNSHQARIARWQALWALEDLPRPLWFVPADAMLALPLEYAGRRQPLDPLFTCPENQYRETRRFNRFYARLQRWLYHDDYIPRFQPQLGIGVFASAFGCQVAFPPDQYPMTHSLIKAGEPHQRVYDLAPPGTDAGQLGDVLAYASLFNSRVRGKVPIALTDLQGPLDTAYLIWDSCDFMVAMKRHPEAVHHLLGLVTDLIIRFVHELRSRVDWFVPAHFPPVYLPDGQGITVSEDVLAMLSPEMYERFSLPYVNRLSEEFGGVVIHSCGNIQHQFDVLGRVHNLRGLNFGITETSFEAAWRRFGGKTVLIPHYSPVSMVASFKNVYEWVPHVLRHRTHNRGLALMVAPDVGDAHAAELQMALGHPPGLYANLLPLLLFGRAMRRMLRTRR